MTSRQQEHTQATSAAKAGISERSGRLIEAGKRINHPKTTRHWRTRHDPLKAVWKAELIPLLEQSPNLYIIGVRQGKYKNN